MRDFSRRRPEGLVSCLPFDHGDMRDESFVGSSVIGTGTSHNGTSIEFDAGDYLNLGNHSEHEPRDGAGNDLPMSWEWWFNADSWAGSPTSSNNWAAMGTKGNSTATTWVVNHRDGGSPSPSFVLFLYQDSSPLIYIGRYWTHSGSLLNQDFHLLITYDGSEAQSGMKCFIDGVEETTTTDVGAGTYTGCESTVGATRIGYRDFGGNNDHHIDGTLYGFRMWSKDMSSYAGQLYAKGKR